MTSKAIMREKKRRQKTSNATACGKRGEDKEQRKDQMTRKHEIRL